jgi:hypothetical protein
MGRKLFTAECNIERRSRAFSPVRETLDNSKGMSISNVVLSDALLGFGYLSAARDCTQPADRTNALEPPGFLLLSYPSMRETKSWLGRPNRTLIGSTASLVSMGV